MNRIKVISPVDNSVYRTIDLHSKSDVSLSLEKAKKGQNEWAELSLSSRKEYVTNLVDLIESQKAEIAEEITWQMGRPISQSPGEVNGFVDRARYMIGVADQALASYHPEEIVGFNRWIEHEPLGVVAVFSPWNYPFLTSVNAIVPALVAGNAVILKHSFQTPLVAERYLSAAQKAGFPEGAFQILHISHEDTAELIADSRIDGVFFTGSVEGGLAVQQSLSDKFIPCGLELGGKDPAYVMADSNLDFAVENLVDGAFFNSGQSCCGIERIYVHQRLYASFVDRFVELTKKYSLGNPLESTTNLGPMVRSSSADFVRMQTNQAVSGGAKALIDESLFPSSKQGSPYLAPQVLVDVNHSMDVMKEESFGPVVGIMKVKDDQEALQLMNDSKYGLTASLWTQDEQKAGEVGRRIQTGTVFMNRCDYLDPALAWTGVKNTGRGVTLSALGYDYVTRVKSFHLKLAK